MKRLIAFLFLCLPFMSFAQKDVTFIVDMRDYSGSYNGVYVNGTWNNWCGTCNPMSDPEGDSVWTVTLPLTADSVEYKFTLDGWTGQESLTSGTTCTKTTGIYTNRFAILNGDTILPGVAWESCGPKSGQVYMTFQVNMEYTAVDSTGVYLAGGTGFGTPGTNQMYPIGDSVYSKTLPADTGFYSMFTFLSANDPSWGAKENIVGLTCAAGQWSDRDMVGYSSTNGLTSDFHYRTCFGQCSTDGSCTAPATANDVTFRVDMSNVTSSFTNVYVSGTLNSWSGNSNQLTDPDGDGVYTGTLSLMPGSYEYKFTYDNWVGQESLDPTLDSACTLTTGIYTNRYATFGNADTTLPVVCWESCASCPVQTNFVVTFMVNTANITVGSNGLYLGGGVIGGANAVQLLDPDGDGIYVGTDTLNGSNGGNFIFLNSPSNASDWGTKENLAGLSCADPNNYNDRILPSFSQDTTLMFCFGTCSTDTSCAVTTTNPDVTFQVDMNNVSASYSNVYISGTMNSWSGNANQMSDADGDGVYDITLTLAPAAYEYKFTYDNWTGQESLDPTADSACTLTTGIYTNRYSVIGSADTTLPAVCWEECASCSPTFDSIVAISTITGIDANGVADSLEAMKWIKGIVTSIDFDGNAGYSFYVTDGTDGINIYHYSDQSGYTSPAMGDSLVLHGEVDQYRGLTELFVDSIYQIGSGYTLPTPTVVTSLGESTESELITLAGFNLVNASQWPSTGSSANVDITNGTDTLTMRIDSDTDIDGSTAPSGTFDVTGLGSQYDFSSPYTEGYQIFPRMLTDIVPATSNNPTFDSIVAISTITGVDANGVADSLEAMKWIKGIVTSIDFDGNAGYSFYVTDGTDGINIYHYSDQSGYTSPAMGDSLVLHGEVDQYRGLTELFVDSIYQIGSGYTLPTPTVVTSLGESTESELITLAGFNLVNASQWPSTGSSANVDITNGTDTLTMRIDSDTDIDGSTAPSGTFDVTGLGSQYDFSSPYTEGYQIFPRMLTDIVPATSNNPTFDSIVAISTITGVDANGVADSLEAMKWIKGIVTSIDFDGNGGYSFYVTDGTDGINIYHYSDQSGYTSPAMGDSLVLHGEVDQFRGLTELFVDSIYQLGSGYTLPTPTVVTTLDESTESELIQLIGFNLVDPTQWPSTGSSANVDITNGTDTLTMRIDSDTDIDGSPAPAGTFDVTGLGSQYDFSSPYTEGYQIFPRMLTDIFEYPYIPTYTIGQVDGIDADGVPDSLNVYCKVEGIVMGVDMQGSATAVSFTVHDGTDGLGTYSSVATAASYNVTEGDEVRIIGSIGHFNGLLQMYLDSVVVLSTGNTLQSPTVVTSLGENTESELIKFENATMVDPTQWGSGSSGYTIDITNGTDTIVMRIDADVNLYGTTAPTGAFDVVGIGGQYDWSAPHDDGYQLLPRYIADITPAAAVWVPEIVVSEIMAGSNSTGYNADWFEIYNYGDTVVNIGGFSWDDESDISGTSVFPSVTIAPGEAIVVLDDLSARKDSFLMEWKLYPGSVTIIANDELTGSFPSLSQNGDGVYLYNASGAALTNSLYSAATAGYSVEFDTTGAFTGDAVDGTNGAYTSLEGDVGSPGNLTPNSNVNEQSIVRNIYPNPTTGMFTVELGIELAYTVQVVNMVGETIAVEQGVGNAVRMDLNAAAGTYLVKVVTDRGTQTLRVVLQ